MKRMVEKQSDQEELSPMDPPEAYEPPNLEAVPYEEMHPFLQELQDEHKAYVEKLDTFEEALLQIQQNGVDRGFEEKLREFFHFFDNEIVKHSQREDKILFPLLHQRLIEKGEHSQGPAPTTSVNMLEDDHIEAIQLAALSFNFFGLAARLPDPKSQVMVLDAAINQGKNLIEHLRLHIFREDNVVFTEAHNHITNEEFDLMSRGTPKLVHG
ncbi:unnamed protein product [marine sediment metagenome]|uniref:Hemerythrin-like domain-containing protein n=1 Tax=marine sediment metagenome TaxID=412755 RepID=X0T549_9ZZZZ